ncbi:MAG: ribonuclease P protein component [Candidatus Moraniibacteriota bacterium]
MLPKQYRLNRADFDIVYKKGRRVRGKNFGLIYLVSDDKNEPSKIGIVVSKKVLKNAVDRNKLKRQVRSVLIKNTIETLPPGYRIVLTAFSAPKTREFEEIKNELMDLFRKIF